MHHPYRRGEVEWVNGPYYHYSLDVVGLVNVPVRPFVEELVNALVHPYMEEWVMPHLFVGGLVMLHLFVEELVMPHPYMEGLVMLHLFEGE